MDQEPIRIVTVCGTTRPGNFTSRALRLVEDELRNLNAVPERLDPSEVTLAFPGWNGGSRESLRDLFRSATGAVLATPEYHGTFSACLKLVIENLGFPSLLSTMPVALLGVAAGEIGAVKSLEHLRSCCSHVGAIVLPGSVSVARVQELFDEGGSCLDARIERRVRGVAGNLMDYIRQNICPRVALESLVRGGR